MNCHRSAKLVSLLLLSALLSLSVVSAQEEVPTDLESNRLGNFFLSVQGWVAQPTGLQYVPATEVSPTAFSDATAIELDHGTEFEQRYDFDWELPSDFGTVSAKIFKHLDTVTRQEFDPANFVFGETLAHPLFAGVNNDRLADGYSSAATTRLRETRIEFQRRAFSSPRVSADWFVGWRRVEHSRELAAAYHALVPGFPPLLPPAGFCDPVPFCPLVPRPDTGAIVSQFEGRGATVGVKLEFPLWKSRLVIESDMALSVMRGDTRTQYASENHIYLLEASPGTFILLGPPYDEFDDVTLGPGGVIEPLLDKISQRDIPVSLSSDLSTNSQVYEVSLGIRWRTPYKRLEAFAGIRQAHYQNVGVDLRPQISTLTITDEGLLLYSVQDIQQLDRSVTYEGLYGGLRFRLY